MILYQNLFSSNFSLTVADGATNITSISSALVDGDVDTYFSYSVTLAFPGFMEIDFAFSTATTISSFIFRNNNFSSFCREMSLYSGNDSATSVLIMDWGPTTISAIPNNLIVDTSAYPSKIYVLQFYPSSDVTATPTRIGEIQLVTNALNFERNPSHGNYSPMIYRKQIRHEMPNGGVVLYNIEDKYRAKISFDFISEDFKNDLYSFWNTNSTYSFIPFESDGNIYPVSWVGNFDFKPSDNNIDAGWSGSIMLEETP